MSDIELHESTCVHGHRIADCIVCYSFLSMHMAPCFKRFNEMRAQRDRSELFREEYHGQIMQATGLLRKEGQCVNSLFSMVQRIIAEKHDLQIRLDEAITDATNVARDKSKKVKAKR